MGSLPLTSLLVLNNMGDHILLDLNEWALILNKMLRYHYNISEEIKTVVQSIRTEMRPELIPLAEEKANFGKQVKAAVREMWGLEYEVDGLQSQFSESIGAMDLDNMDVDFIEDMMLRLQQRHLLLKQSQLQLRPCLQCNVDVASHPF